MIDDDLVIDFGPDLDSACRDFGIVLADVQWVLQTHPHADHILPLHAIARGVSWGAESAKALQWFGADSSIETILNGLGKSAAKMDMAVDTPSASKKLHLTTIQSWQEISFGAYRVQTIAANHDPAVDPMLFAIEKNGRRILWASDTSTLPEDTWPRVAELGWTFDVVVFDHNDGFTRPASPTHMGSKAMLSEYATMKSLGLVNDSTRLLGTHIAHHSNTIHEVEAERARALGYDIAYDGLIVNV